MRRIAVFVLLSALLGVAGVVVAAPASACSCALPPDAGIHFTNADAVFSGRLISREVEHPDWPIASSDDPALHVFAVERVFKGVVHEEQGVVSADSGASCGLELSGEGPFIVYATRSSEGYTAGLCGGTTLATPELEAELAALAGRGAGPARLPGADGTDPAGPATLPLALGAAAVLLVLLVALRLRARRGAARPVPDRG